MEATFPEASVAEFTFRGRSVSDEMNRGSVPIRRQTLHLTRFHRTSIMSLKLLDTFIVTVVIKI